MAEQRKKRKSSRDVIAEVLREQSDELLGLEIELKRLEIQELKRAERLSKVDEKLVREALKLDKRRRRFYNV